MNDNELDNNQSVLTSKDSIVSLMKLITGDTLVGLTTTELLSAFNDGSTKNILIHCPLILCVEDEDGGVVWYDAIPFTEKKATQHIRLTSLPVAQAIPSKRLIKAYLKEIRNYYNFDDDDIQSTMGKVVRFPRPLVS